IQPSQPNKTAPVRRQLNIPARIGRGSEVRVHGTVHLRTRLEPGAMVPIGWVAVGDPARILPPDRHDEIWEVQKPLNFAEWVYGCEGRPPARRRRVPRRCPAPTNSPF